MKYVLSVIVLLAAPLMAKACEPLGVCSSAVVQNFGVVGSHVQVQTFTPVAVQSFAVPTVAVVQNAGHCGVASVRSVVRSPRVVVQNVRPQRSVVRTRTVQRVR